LNYFNYFTEIEQFYQTRRESFTLLSTLDWVLIENWKEQGVPLDFVLKGIDRAFSRAKRKINSLAYCIKAVEEIIEEQKEGRVERPELQQISTQETRQYLEDLAQKTAAVSLEIPEFAAKINNLAESVRVVDATNFRDAEQILEALEERLLAILRVAADESVLVEIQRDVEAELGPFRSSMTAAQLAMLEQQLSRRKLLERYNVPRLSLFYLM
jgi:polyhydroxyalkanoate synthesis regulator phasin